MPHQAGGCTVWRSALRTACTGKLPDRDELAGGEGKFLSAQLRKGIDQR